MLAKHLKADEAGMLKVGGDIKTPHGVSPFKFEVARDQALSPRFLDVEGVRK